MAVRMVAKIFGLLLMFFSLSMLPPLGIAWAYHEHNSLSFLLTFVIVLGCGFALWLPNRRMNTDLPIRSGFLIVFLSWALLCLFGSLPFLLSYEPHLAFTRAVFETISSLTTVGATTLTHLDSLPKSILYYRQQLQFLGGMGIVVLAIAVMPLLGLGGMHLFQAEASSLSKETKLTPRITDTAKALWVIYAGLNVLCALAYWLSGMTPFDAICYAFSTVATGGSAPHDAGIAYYPHTAVYIVCMIFMFLGGTNFSLHYQAFQRRSLKVYWHNLESRIYLLLIIAFSLMTMVILYTYSRQTYHGSSLVMDSFFQIISFFSTTGYVNGVDFSHWPSFLPLLLIFIAIAGGCSGSTSGGIKIARCIILVKQVSREIKQLIHPRGIFPVKLGNQLIQQSIANRVWAFLSAYSAVFLLLWLALVASGLPIDTAFYAIASCLSNVGTGLGAVAYNFSGFHNSSLWILAIAMLIGRLDIFTVLVLLSPTFWRR